MDKDFVFHARGGGEKLEAAVEGMRAMARDPGVRLERLMFTKGLETVVRWSGERGPAKARENPRG